MHKHLSQSPSEKDKSREQLIEEVAELRDQLSAQKRYSESLREKEDSYERLFRSIQEGFGLAEIILDGNGKPFDFRLLDVNQAFGRFTGINPETAKGKTARELSLNLDPYWFDIFGRVALNSGSTHFEAERKVFGKWFEVYAFSPGYGKFGLLFIDITNRKLTEKNLADAYRLLESVANSTHVMLACLDPQFNFRWVNSAYAKGGHRKPEEYIGRNHFELYPHKENEAIFRWVAETGKPYEVYAKPFVHPDQPERGVTYWDWRLEPFLDTNGSVEMLLFSLTDVTGRERRKQELRASLQERNLVLDNTVEIISHHDTDHNIQWGNKSFVEATGKTLSELTGMKCYEAWGFDRPCKDCPAARAMETGQPQEGELSADKIADWPPELGCWLVRAAPVKDKAGNVTGVIEVAHDVTEQRQTEESLRQLNAKLEQIVADRTELAEVRAKHLSRLSLELTMAEHRERQQLARMLHDNLQQLLAAAKMQLESMAANISGDNKKDALEISDLLSESIRSTRSLTRELSPPVRQKGGFAAALEWLADWMRSTHRLRVDLRINTRVEIEGEELGILIFQSIRELLFNIVKHAGTKQAEVEVNGTSNNFIKIMVRDHGRGFDPDSIHCDDQSPTGFGLFSIRERLTLIGGNLNIDSLIGSGSCFTMTVPKQARPTAQDKF